MSDEYARAWLSELWATCREWRQTKDERLAAEARNEHLSRSENGDERPSEIHRISTGYPETGDGERPAQGPKCA